MTTLRINSDRLWLSLMQLGQIGATPKGGVCRLALTDEDRQGRDLFIEWCREIGLEVRIDEIGNIFARRPGTDPDRRAIAMGSHIDTQPTGGKFDGNYGVMAGLEVLRTLHEHGIQTEAPLEVIAWTNEEGSRFVPVMMGSGVFSGAFTLAHALAATDTQGLSVGDELQRIGYAGTHPAGDVPGGMFEAYIEAHIEQGPILEAHDLPVGIVPGALGQRWYNVTLSGMEAHAGPTPMDMRHDALLAAASLVTKVNQIAMDHAPHARGTVGYMNVMPNSRNTIPGSVAMSVDFRALDDATLLSMHNALHSHAELLQRHDSKLSIEIEQVVYFPPCHFTPTCIATVRQAADKLGIGHMEVVSGAGHDAVYVANLAPTAMIFVPCKDGISHNELEDAKPEHLAMGADVLLHAVLQLANGGKS
ncbi:Zn-dependent hydrolase [Corticimicrobacter populi]|uniref:Zn-dependent hydrolase n=1 Tax=Corticimicrobacter populi TaxID=2175229 RepID=A0A2V1JUB8_9BURK|nr:Zn-dependent hydrolase [Corticimicrobacter populi]PWF21486.1 Zn-dependent hydrolase [Corticimicrobacter populi]